MDKAHEFSRAVDEALAPIPDTNPWEGMDRVRSLVVRFDAREPAESTYTLPDGSACQRRGKLWHHWPAADSSTVPQLAVAEVDSVRFGHKLGPWHTYRGASLGFTQYHADCLNCHNGTVVVRVGPTVEKPYTGDIYYPGAYTCAGRRS